MKPSTTMGISKSNQRNNVQTQSEADVNKKEIRSMTGGAFKGTAGYASAAGELNSPRSGSNNKVIQHHSN